MHRTPDTRLLPWPWHWPWPLPAVAGWLAAWAVFVAGRPALGVTVAGGAAAAVGMAAAWPLRRAWRRALVALGFPLSALVTGWAEGLPPWTWLLPLSLLAVAYPVRAWRDAPFFPTPAGALDAIARDLPLPGRARVIDDGCGMGHGLQALRSAWPRARIEGVEWSWPLALAARMRCRWARVTRGDMWAESWRGASAVYVFQRPESMAGVWAKACAELEPGAWLLSLEFVVPGRPADRSVQGAGGRPVHAWRIPPTAGPGADEDPATTGPRPGALNPAAAAPINPGNAHAPPARA